MAHARRPIRLFTPMIQPIFIFSLPRSGPTLLQRILMNSGQASSLGETNLLLRLLGDDELTARRSVYGELLVNASIDDMKRHWPGLSTALEKPLPAIAGKTSVDGTEDKKFNAISTESLNRWEQVYSIFYRKNWAKEYVNNKRAEAMAPYDYRLPESIPKFSASGWLSGIKEMISASSRRKNLITEPQWLPRSLEYYRLTHGFDVTWR